MFKVIISESVYQDIVSTEEQKAEEARTYLYKLLKQQTVKLLTAEETERYKSHPENVLKNPSALFVLDMTRTEALAIQRTYGVICLGRDSRSISPLIDVNDIHISNEDETLGRGWDSVLDSVEDLPSNALLLTDRYLFSARRPNFGNGIANVQSILEELLPQQFLGGAYHVTILFDNQAKHETYSFNDIVEQLEGVKQDLQQSLNLDYPIMMEVIGITPDTPIYFKLHNRLIISNYYMVEAAHKLAAFNKNIGTTRQLLLPLALFTESSLNGKSTPPLKAIDQTLYSLRVFSKTLPTLSEAEQNTIFYAVDGKRMKKCMAIRNRLIK